MMTEWLDSHGICYAEDTLKIDLSEIITFNKDELPTSLPPAAYCDWKKLVTVKTTGWVKNAIFKVHNVKN